MLHYKFKSSREWMSIPIVAKIRRDDLASMLAAKHGLKRVYITTPGDVFYRDSWVSIAAAATAAATAAAATAAATAGGAATAAATAPPLPLPRESYDIDDEFGPDVYFAHPPVFSGVFEIVSALGELGIAAKACQPKIFEIVGRLSVGGLDEIAVRDLCAWKERVKRESQNGMEGIWPAILRLERALAFLF